MSEPQNSIENMWNSLPANRRISVIASVLAVIAVLGAVVYFSSKPKLSLLYSNLSSAEAAKIVSHLESNNITYEISNGGSTILVPAPDVYTTRIALAEQGIPRTADSAGGVGFEMFDKPSFGMSDFMQKANYHRALQGELARTIRQMAEIDDARVIIVVPEERLFSRSRRESKASVFLKVAPGRILNDENVRAIRFLVANGVAGLQPERVAIVDSSGRALAANNGTIGLQLSMQQQSMTREMESHLAEKAQSMLDRVLGVGEAVVRVTAELNFDAVQQTSETYDPKATVVRSENLTTEKNLSEEAGAGGVTGVAGNTPGSEDDSSSRSSSSLQEKENVTNEYEINRVVETRQRSIGEIKRLSVAVFVNMRKQGLGAGATSSPRTATELRAIEDIVKQSVGYTAAGGRADTISVQETQFADLFADGTEDSGTSDMMKQVDQVLPYISQIFLGVLAVGVLMYFMSLVKGSAEASHEVDAEFADLLARLEQADPEAEEVESGKPRARFGAEEMSKIIRDNPTNTAQAIKEWIARN